MLTLVTIPKAFDGHFAIIQENAIRSWTRLGQNLSVILFGDDPGTAEAASRLGVSHIPDIERNEYGTPLLHDVFRQADEASAHDVVCYVNADIILLSDFTDAVQSCRRAKRRFLMVGQRTDYNMTHSLECKATAWERDLRADVARSGTLHRPTGIDYFVYRRGMWGRIPPFAIGRFSWDNWLIHRALQLHVPVIDATQRVLAIHQNHDYSHATGGARGARNGPEARENFKLAGGLQKSYTIWDSTHVLDETGLRKRGFDSGLGGGIWSYRRSVKIA